MIESRARPTVYRIAHREAQSIRSGPTGDVGTLFSDSGFEVVWVSKEEEAIDRKWFSRSSVDLLLVIQGKLRVDFKSQQLKSLVLKPGDLFLLPPRVKCRAYRWPRSSRKATVFAAIYPVRPKARGRVPTSSHRSG